MQAGIDIEDIGSWFNLQLDPVSKDTLSTTLLFWERQQTWIWMNILSGASTSLLSFNSFVLVVQQLKDEQREVGGAGVRT